MADYKAARPLDDLIGQSQRTLLDFIKTELDLGATFADVARTEKDLGNEEHFARSKGDAETAVRTARSFAQKILKSETRAALEKSCSELEENISSL